MLSIIVAASENRVIGRSGDMPWRLSEDLKRFKRLTMGHAMLMGRKTWDSLGRPLPGRASIVVTRNVAWQADGACVANSLESAMEMAKTADIPHPEEAFLIGGGELFTLGIPLAQKIYRTVVHAELEGDTFFPAIDWNAWTCSHSEKIPADEENMFATTFEIWERR